MPPEDDNTDLPSSEQITDVTEATAADATDAGAADPSSANETDEPKDMLSVVRDVVDTSKEPAPSAEETAEETATNDATTPEAEEQDDAEFTDAPFHKHPRFQQLLRQKKEFEADAGQYRTVQSFLKENNLSPDEAANGLQLVALMKADPRKALDALRPHVQRLLEVTGETLPADLREQVQRGDMPLDVAKQVSRARASELRMQETQQQVEQQRQQAERERLGNQLRDTASSWLQDRAVRDPAFQSKEPLMQREVAFLQRAEGIPNTPEGVKDQLNRAYQSVNQQARVSAPAAPARPAVRPITGGAAPGTPAPEPSNMLEALKLSSGAK